MINDLIALLFILGFIRAIIAFLDEFFTPFLWLLLDVLEKMVNVVNDRVKKWLRK